MQKFYYFYNKHNAIIYKCDSYEVMIKHYLQDKGIIEKVKYQQTKHQNYYKMEEKDMYKTYSDFASDMLSRGFTWDEIEYYWRNPDEFEELCDEEVEQCKN